MYGIFPYIWLIFMVHEGNYTIHGSYGNYNKISKDSRGLCDPQLPIFAYRLCFPHQAYVWEWYIYLSIYISIYIYIYIYLYISINISIYIYIYIYLYIYIYPRGGRFTGNSCPVGVYIYEVTRWLMLRK